MNCRKAWSVDSKTCNSFKQPMVANQNTRNLNKKHIITAPINRLRCLLFVEALEIHGAAVTDDPLLVSSIHWLTFFVKMSRGRAPSLRMIEWKSLMSNFDPAKMKIKKKNQAKMRMQQNHQIKKNPTIAIYCFDFLLRFIKCLYWKVQIYNLNTSYLCPDICLLLFFMVVFINFFRTGVKKWFLSNSIRAYQTYISLKVHVNEHDMRGFF